MKYNSTEQTIAWFKDRYKRQELEIKPPYQRRPVWAPRQKSALIESVLLHLPIPEVYVHTTTSKDGASKYAVVDGQQRIRTILQFLGLDKDEHESEENDFELTNLPVESSWADKSFEGLSSIDKKAFYSYKLAVRMLDDATPTEVKDMFKRLNKYLTKLNEQELRNATYSGPFITLVRRIADDDYWAENGLVSAALIRRMKDIEFVSEVIIGVMNGPQGGSPSVINDYYLQLEQYSDEFPRQKEVERLYKQTFNLIGILYDDLRPTRWRNRTDFYTLFVSSAGILHKHTLPSRAEPKLRAALDHVAELVSEKIADVDKRVPAGVSEYARAAQKGSSDKSRRAARHKAMTALIQPFFVAR